MNAEALYEIFKATSPKKEHQRFMHLLDTEKQEVKPSKNNDLRMQILSAPKRKIPNVA